MLTTTVSSTTRRCDGYQRPTCLSGILLADRIKGLFCAVKERKLVKFLHEDVILLVYLADIFGKLNELNLFLQGQDKTITNFIKALSGFQKNSNSGEDDNGPNGNVLNQFPTLNEAIKTP